MPRASKKRKLDEANSGAAIPLRPAPRVLGAPSNAALYGTAPDDLKSSDEVFQHDFVRSLLDFAQQQVPRHADWVVCIRTYGRSGLEEGCKPGDKPKGGITQYTLKALADAGLRRGVSRRIDKLLEQVFIFVSHEDPHYVSGRYELALGDEWRERIVVGIKGADRQVRFIEECFHAGQHIIICDDNISWIKGIGGEQYKFRGLKQEPCELDQLFQAAAKAMQKEDANLWGINPCHNTVWMSSVQTAVLRDAPKGAEELATTARKKLGLVYGAFFGVFVRHDPELYTQFGQVKDDLERTLRYWHRDRSIVRFMQYTCCKQAPPGTYAKKKGGISADSSNDAHRLEGEDAVHKMAHGFAKLYVRMPNHQHEKRDKTTGEVLRRADGRPLWTGRVSLTGVIFCGAETVRLSCEPDCLLKVGYLCTRCCPRDPEHTFGLQSNLEERQERRRCRKKMSQNPMPGTPMPGTPSARASIPRTPLPRTPVPRTPIPKTPLPGTPNPQGSGRMCLGECECVDPLQSLAKTIFTEEGLVAVGGKAGDAQTLEASEILDAQWARLSKEIRLPYEEIASVRLRKLQWKAPRGRQKKRHSGDDSAEPEERQQRASKSRAH